MKPKHSKPDSRGMMFVACSALASLELCSTNSNQEETDEMDPIKRLTAAAMTFAMPGLTTMQMPQPHVRTRMKKRRYQAGSKPRKQHTTSSTRQFIRYQQRLAWAYKPGTIGVSDVSAAIKKEYGSIRSRWQRKYYAKALRKPFITFTAQR